MRPETGKPRRTLDLGCREDCAAMRGGREIGGGK